MFTIDLLKGQGIPRKSRPRDMVIVVATLLVPIIIAQVMFGIYVLDRIIISIREQEISNYESKIADLSEAVELQKSFENEKKMYSSSLSEVSSSIGRHTQWSPVLVSVVENIPSSLVLTRLEVKQRSVRKKVPRKDEPGEMVDLAVPVRTLQMSVATIAQSDSDEAIRNFTDRLRSSSLLGPRLENIRVSQTFDSLEGKDVVCYQIDCMFKSEI